MTEETKNNMGIAFIFVVSIISFIFGVVWIVMYRHHQIEKCIDARGVETCGLIYVLNQES